MVSSITLEKSLKIDNTAKMIILMCLNDIVAEVNLNQIAEL